MENPDNTRDLDAWIATHMFDMHEFEPNSVNNCICDSCGKDNSFSDHFRKGWAQISGSLPRYTTEASPALAVLEKCARKTINLEIDFRNGDTFAVGCYRRSKIIEAVADTLPLAICRFARKIFEK